LDVSLWIWVALAGAVGAVLLVDLLLFHRSPQEVSIRQAAAWSVVWFTLAIGFAGVVWAWLGAHAATEYLTGYIVERSLSIDNIFVFAVILTYFAVPTAYRHRALVWGVLGALGLRVLFIAGGAVALQRVAWTIYVMGGFLIATGIRLAISEIEADPDRNVALRLVRHLVPMTRRFHGQRVFVRRRALLATPMLAVLVAIATTDLVFAADSVPAIYAVTSDPFLVFAANAFSVLGMVALYFLLAGMMRRFRLLRPALAVILVFVGVKMAIADVYEIPIAASLLVIVGALAAASIGSLLFERRPTQAPIIAHQSVPREPAERVVTRRRAA
jgi:tellurite resistance protein TerC